jgi:ATP-binding cassette subfamily C protein PrsD
MPNSKIQKGGETVVSELAAALARCRSAFIAVAMLSGGINVLYLTGSFFMLEVYDRVIPSRSVPTLVGLGAIALLLYVCQGLLDLIRGRLVVRVGAAFDDAVCARIFGILMRLPLAARAKDSGLQALRDLDQIRGFLSSAGPSALCDLPWIPLYLSICFLFHPFIGIAVLAGTVFLVSLTLATELRTRAPSRRAAAHATTRNALAEAGRRNAEVLRALGMSRRMTDIWSAANAGYIDSQQKLTDVTAGFGSVSRIARLILQSTVLGIGAYLVINQEATAGVMIASSILSSRALAPAELAIANWKGFVAARQGWRRLKTLLDQFPAGDGRMPLPAPCRGFAAEAAAAVVPGSHKAVVQDVTFALEAGQALGIIGPSASGKSSLARLLVGIWRPARGAVRIDGADLEQWDADALGRHIGYLPQDVELFAGTIAENISRFEPAEDAEAILAAARAAGVHEMILRLADGYDTQIGDGGAFLSAGQRQRIALARALFREPFLVVLDEPNSNLDSEGDRALTEAIRGVRARGGIAIVVAHRPSALAAVDLVLMMQDGRPKMVGPKAEVLAKTLVAAPPARPGETAPLRVVREPQEAAQ